MNNYERIKGMNLDEMALYLKKHIDCPCCPARDFCDCDNNFCFRAFKKYLESEASE